MFKHSLIIFIMLLTTGFFVLGLDDQGNENNPNENERANACYEFGTMADKCDTLWEWECGYYLIRLEYGLLSQDQFPSGCGSLISSGGAGCQPVLGNFVFFGGNFLSAGTTTFADAACTTPNGSTTLPLVYTANGAPDATAICTSHGFVSSGLIEGNVHHCS